MLDKLFHIIDSPMQLDTVSKVLRNLSDAVVLIELSLKQGYEKDLAIDLLIEILEASKERQCNPYHEAPQESSTFQSRCC